MSPILTLSDAGFRQFGPLPVFGGGIDALRAAQAASQCGDYEAAGAWVRRRGRKRGVNPVRSFEIIDVIATDTPLVGDRLRFIDEFWTSEYANADVPELTTDDDVLLSLVEDAENEDCRWRGMYRLSQALHYAGRARLKPLFRDRVAPCFFRLYPGGRIAVVRYDAENDEAAALMRTLYAAAQTPLGQIDRGSFGGFRTLQEWHLNSLTLLGPVLFEIFNFLFYPFVCGSRGGPVGLDFFFLFEPQEAYSPAVYPRNWLAVASTTAGFGREDVDLYASLRNVGGPEWEHAAHQRFRHLRPYTISERLLLLRWYVNRVNRLLYELTDVANFTEGRDPQSAIDPVFAFEHHLTVDRLARKTLLAMSLEEVGTAKHLMYEVAELYDGLSNLFGNNAGGGDFFKKLFDTQAASGLLQGRLAQLPAPFGTELPVLAAELYRKIEETVVNSVWLTSKVTPQGVMVRKKADPACEEMVPRHQFVAELMRAYRNAHHGYFSAADKNSNRPSRYLFLVDGNLPAELTALPALWWLAYLADPGLVGWRYLPIDEFD